MEHCLVFQPANVLALLAGHQITSRRPAHHEEHLNACAFGQPGDLITVRELWRPHVDPTFGPCVQFAADQKLCVPNDQADRAWCASRASSSWWPAGKLPRWASRLTLTLSSVTQQPIEEMTKLDAIDEGVAPKIGRDPLEAFCTEWRRIYGPSSWRTGTMLRIVRFPRFK